jgi:uncharacterized protein
VLAVLVLPVGAALGVLLPLLILGDAFALGARWRRWDLRAVGRLLPGAVVGIGAGTYLLAQADSPVLARLLGALVLMFALYWVIEPRLMRHVAGRLSPPTQIGMRGRCRGTAVSAKPSTT